MPSPKAVVTRALPVLGRGLLPAALTALLALSAACGRVPEVQPPRHVFLITVDTLRADHMSLYGYPRDTSPRLDRLAEGSTVFQQAIVQWPKTGPSFASIFTGRYPQTTGLTHEASIELPDSYLTLPQFFRQQGFTTLGIVSNAVLSAEEGWSAGFDEYLETWKLGGPEASGSPGKYRLWNNALKVNEAALPLLERYAAEPRLFVWIHYIDPHAPYQLPKGFENPFLGDPLDKGDRLVARGDIRRSHRLGKSRRLPFYVAHYDANILVADLHIQQLIDRARELGLMEDALLVFTADHGESLGEHGSYFEHGPLPYSPTLRVPLLVHRPGAVAAGRRVAPPVELLGLYPTLVELIDPEAEVEGLEGESFAAVLAERSEKAQSELARRALAFAGAGIPGRTHYRTVQDPRWKLVFHPPLLRKGKTIPAEYQLFDLDADPLETRDLASSHPEEMTRLGRELTSWSGGAEWITHPEHSAREVSEETEKALRALGYIQ